MRKLYLGNGDKQFKFADTTAEIHLNAFDDGSASTLTADAKVRIKNDSGYLLGVSASITDNHAVITSGQLAQLPVGSYLIELWDTVDGGTAIYPSEGFLALQINDNVTGLSGGIVSSVTIDDFIKQFSSLSEQLKQQVSNAVANGLKGDKGDDGLSTYQIAVNAGFTGNISQWLASLVGPKGEDGIEMPAPYTSRDLNSLMTPSINFCADNNNKPDQIGKYEAYILINYVNGSGISQAIISQKNVYLRNGKITNGTATFEEWSQLIPEIEVVKSITVDKSLVSPNGDTTFSSFVEAMKYAYSLNEKVDVHVKNGTYDMIQEFSDKYGSDYLNTTTTEEGCYIGNGMHIVFEPDAQIVCHYSGANTQILSMFSPLTAKDSDYILENVKIDSKNVRYSVHDDPNGAYYEHRYIDCEFNHDNSSNSVSTTAPFAIGGGLSKNCKIVILGGRYSTVAKTGIDTAPISYHNSVFDGAKSSIIVRNVYLDGALRFTWWGPSKKLTNVLVSGCSTISGIITHVEAGGAGYDDNNNFKITSWNNEIRNQ